MPVSSLTSFITRSLIILFLAITTINASATNDTPSDTVILDNPDCLKCHEKHDSSLIEAWQISAHAKARPVVNCVSCHGRSHKDIASTARHDEVCVACHGGDKKPVTHSYTNSKHGTLMRIEKNTYNWNQPFVSANYRTPGCGYCHMHDTNHNISLTVRHNLMNDAETEKIHDYTRAVCQDCHSPRYITDLFNNGEAMLEIARKKVHEAETLIEQAKTGFSDDQLQPAQKQFTEMLQHIKNVHLGIAHQSPDYQWWHGQPALDGDLLRIKDGISKLQSLKK